MEDLRGQAAKPEDPGGLAKARGERRGNLRRIKFGTGSLQLQPRQLVEGWPLRLRSESGDDDDAQGARRWMRTVAWLVLLLLKRVGWIGLDLVR